MIELLRIERFKCFRQLQLENLSRINIVVGENGSGKTALLEALYLLMGGSPELGWRIRAWRGLPAELKISTTGKDFQDLWSDLFYRLDPSCPINITGRSQASGALRTLKIGFQPHESYVLPFGENGDVESEVRRSPLYFTYQAGDEAPTSVPVQLGTEGLKIDGFVAPLAGVFLHVATKYAMNSAARFSQLSRAKSERPIVEAVREEYPQVEDLSLETQFGTPLLYASVEGLPQKVPLEMVSAGISKYLGMLLAIAATRDGMVLVDEIENGLHYSRMGAVWSRLRKFCKVYNVQLFATTHSSECLRSLSDTLEKDDTDFSLIRTVRGAQETAVDTLTGSMFEAALEQNVEVR